MRTAASMLATFCVLSTAAEAQVVPQVVLSEINFSQQSGSSENQWIEIYNRTPNAVDLSTWSLYQATKTVGMPGTYWWAFPNGTSLPGNSYMRIHWLEPIPTSNPPAGELFTGVGRLFFLFGYGAEDLSGSSGALALLNTQNNSAMNSPGSFVDWVSWGDTGFVRENLAVLNQRWTSGAAAPAVTNRDSLSLDLAQVGLPTPVRAWFRDATPTPGAPGAPGASFATAFGGGTRVSSQLLQEPVLLAAQSPTAPGNRDLVLSVDGTQGLPGEMVYLVFSTTRFATPVRLARLDLWIDPLQMVLDMPGQPGVLGNTPLFDFSLIPSTVPGQTFYAQAVLFNIQNIEILGSTNGIEFTVGQ